ncbi:hypothetical protein NKH18_41235 [Streptomyces sp. M10(2022)]
MTSSFESYTYPARLSDAQRDRVLGVLRDGAAQESSPTTPSCGAWSWP